MCGIKPAVRSEETGMWTAAILPPEGRAVGKAALTAASLAKAKFHTPAENCCIRQKTRSKAAEKPARPVWFCSSSIASVKLRLHLSSSGRFQ